MNVNDMGFTQEQQDKLRELGPDGVMVKMAQHDGFAVDETADHRTNMLSVFGQKYFQKTASLKRVAVGLEALKKLRE